MTVTYDKHYQTEDLFGDPYPKLIEFFANYPKRGKVLDLGCGQGRDAIALARLGYSVVGIDHAKIGIDQMMQVALSGNLNLAGQVADIYAFDKFVEFDFILLDSMFHFAKKDKEKEIGLVRKILSKIKNGCVVVVCIQDTEHKIKILNQALAYDQEHIRLDDEKFKHTFEDRESGHKSETNYRMIVIEKRRHTKQQKP